MPTFSVTYEIVTYESAEHGEAEEIGFVEQDVDLRTAIRAIGGTAYEDAGSWFTNYEYGEDFRTGARESRSLHPPRDITASSYDRIARLLGLGRKA